LKQLKSFALNFNPIFNLTLNPPQKNQSNSSLKSLTLPKPNILNVGAFLEFLQQFELLESLDISHSKFQLLNEDFSFNPLVHTLTTLKMNNQNLITSKCYIHILSAAAKCEKLKNLELGFNDFSELTEVITFKSQDSLVYIDIQSSNLNSFGLISCLNCRNLKILNISGNDLSKISENLIIENSSLEELNVCETNITTAQLYFYLFYFPNLKKIVVQIDLFYDLNPNIFKIMHNSLKTFEIISSKIQINFFNILSHIPSLENIKLTKFDLTYNTENRLGPTIKTLKTLKINVSQISICYLISLSYSVHIERLFIENSKISPSSNKDLHIESLGPELKEVCITKTENIIFFLQCLQNCPKLEKLEIQLDITTEPDIIQGVEAQIQLLKEKNPTLNDKFKRY
jgi:hypothetical protein